MRIATGLLCGLLHTTLLAQGTVTLTTSGTNDTAEITIEADQSARLLSYYDEGYRDGSGPSSYILVIKNALSFHWTPDILLNPQSNRPQGPIAVAGPAVIRLVNYDWLSTVKAMVTLDIQPSQYPPDKSAIIGPHSGPMRCTMETSTDLVNWATATNDIVYPDSETARFFRITLERDVAP